MSPEPARFSWTDGDTLHVNLHEGQRKAWNAEARIVAVISGTQGGKTCFGPLWLHREIQRQGSGDYLVVMPTYQLLMRKTWPEFLRHFRDRLGLGTPNKSEKIFTVHDLGEKRLFGERQEEETRILFGHATKSESLESATAKAAWLDEAGQDDFTLSAYEAVRRRLAIHRGRILITTTPYNLGWLKQQVYDPWRDGSEEIEVVRFESRMNPVFPEETWEEEKQQLPAWKFDLMYRGVFTRPAGLIYDCFDPDAHVVPRFRIPDEWPVMVGLDFGGANTAAVIYRRAPDGRLYLTDEYKAGGRTAKGHVTRLTDGRPFPTFVAGGSRSEGQWRREFRDAGLPVQGPKVKDVEVGIDRVYGLHQRDRIYVFEDCDGYLEEKQTYSRKLDDRDQPTEKIADKHSFHFMDAERYLMGHLAVRSGEDSMAGLVPA